MKIIVPVDRSSGVEATALARSLAHLQVGLLVGHRLLARSGAGVLAPLRAFGEVFADARLGGEAAGIATAAKMYAAGGATYVSVSGGTGIAAVERAMEATAPYGARVAYVPVHPELSADELDAMRPGDGRGKLVSRAVAGVAHLDLDVLGLASDVGVVAQVAPGIGTIVFGVSTADEIEDAVQRGASAVVLARSVTTSGDPAEAVGSLVGVVGSS